MAKNPKILESVYSIRDIQIFGAGSRRMKEVDEANRNVNHASFWLTVHRQTIASFPNFFVYLARILILVCAGVLASRGSIIRSERLPISFPATASLSSTFNLTFVVTSLLETYGAAERIFKIEDTMSETEEPANPVSCGEIQTIEFSDVTFSYPGTEKKVLDHFNFKIRKGEKIGIAGASGLENRRFCVCCCGFMRRRKVKSGSTAFRWNRSALRNCIRGLRFWSRTPICLMQRLPRILPLQNRMLPLKKSEQRQSAPVSRSLSRHCRRAIRPIWVR